MSDFYSELETRHETLLAEAMGLDLHMWRTKRDRPAPFPYPFVPLFSETYNQEYQRRRLSEITERIYWRREPPPRARARRVTMPSFAELYGDGPSKRQNAEIKEIAERLDLTPRHARRMLMKLLRAGEIPSSWFRARQWRAPVDEAIRAIALSEQKKHAPHTKALMSADIEQLVNCRREADKMARELAEIQMIRETCESWNRLTKTALSKTATINEQIRHRKTRWRQAYNFMAKVAEKLSWRFCGLFVAIYESLQNSSKTPVREARVALALTHAEFYRKFAKKEIHEALFIAQLALASPSWLVGRNEMPSEDEGIMSGWRNLVSEEDLWEDL
jgi:hypothetical protein